MKSSLQSKTLKFNLLMAIVAFFPSVREMVSPEVGLWVVTAVNALLRFATKQGVRLPWGK